MVTLIILSKWLRKTLKEDITTSQTVRFKSWLWLCHLPSGLGQITSLENWYDKSVSLIQIT
jgi:hypothetical protein